MNRNRIRSCIEDLGCTARLTDGASKLVVEFIVQGRSVVLYHPFPDELLRAPQFYLQKGHGFGKLAHVLTTEDSEFGEVCIADSLSTVVNTGRPELAYRDTVAKHVELLTRLIEDPAYNREEQLREFDAHWKILCSGSGSITNELFVAWEGNEVERLQVRLPRKTKSGSGLDIRPPSAVADTSVFHLRPKSPKRNKAVRRARRIDHNAVGMRLTHLDPAPATKREVVAWFFDIADRIDCDGRRELERLHRGKGRDYWVIFSAPIPDGEAMFAIHWRRRSKGGLPRSVDEAEAGQWDARPYRVRALSRASLIPRGGGSLDLSNKSVLLVGCGSVGGDLAMRLTSAGVGRLTVSDTDKLSEENLYRHILSMNHIGRQKAEALAHDIGRKHPWAKVESWNRSLECLREPAALKQFDLIVIAVGSPNVERAFAEFCLEESLSVPVINCWLEGYGIGGHAILVVPGTKGCWHCAYVDPETLTPSLLPNLHFLAPGQTVMRDQGGCGTQFLPYSGIAAGYTAAMSADLAVRFLQGHVTTSSKISWKGSDMEANRQRLSVTWRFRHFTESLQILPLHDENCDFCGA